MNQPRQYMSAQAPSRRADETLWLCWSNNYRGRYDSQLYILHACAEPSKKTLCGVRIQEVGDPPIKGDYWPGCKRCLRILAKRSNPIG